MTASASTWQAAGVANTGKPSMGWVRRAMPYMDLIDALFTEVNPIPIKAAMNLLGQEAGPLRLPLCDISDAGGGQHDGQSAPCAEVQQPAQGGGMGEVDDRVRKIWRSCARP